MSHNTSTCSPPVRTHHPFHSTCNSTLSTSPNPVESPVLLYSNMPSLPPKNSLHQSANACHPHPNASSPWGVPTHNHSSPPHAAFKGVEGFKPPLFVLTRARVPLHWRATLHQGGAGRGGSVLLLPCPRWVAIGSSYYSSGHWRVSASTQLSLTFVICKNIWMEECSNPWQPEHAADACQSPWRAISRLPNNYQYILPTMANKMIVELSLAAPLSAALKPSWRTQNSYPRLVKT